MPQRAVVILDQLSANPPIYRYLLRADVPSARQSFYANPGYQSTFQPISPDSDPDLSALKSGAVVERLDQVQLPPGATVPQVQAELIVRQTVYQTTVTNESKYSRYGTFYNGTSWTAAGV